MMLSHTIRNNVLNSFVFNMNLLRLGVEIHIVFKD